MKFIDLSHPISNTMPTYPSDPGISINREKNINIDNSLVHSFKMGSHTGTHLDVAAHITPNGKTISDYSLDSFTGVAIKVDKDSFNSLDQFSNKIDGVLFDSDWYRFFDDPDKYYGSLRPIIPMKMINKLLKMKLKFFGCDLPSVDVSGIKEKPIHHTLLDGDIIIYESLTNLNKLPVCTPFQFFGFPLPFEKLDGSPVRAVAFLK
tara:strand:- start:1007 stop:1624 length:618 start_codon:yes stop_codon:yes gene_type:complete